ncbi:MAG: hypothetical protein ACRD4S_01150 [Candidatus Acidiferrales bacterium]
MACLRIINCKRISAVNVETLFWSVAARLQSSRPNAARARLFNIYKPVIAESFWIRFTFKRRQFPMNLNYLRKEIDRLMAVLTRSVEGRIIGEEFILSLRAYSYCGHSNISACFTFETEVVGGHLLFWRSAALAFFTHGLNLSEVVRTAFGGCPSATPTEGNGSFVFLCHAARVQKALAVCKKELCINSILTPIANALNLWYYVVAFVA